MRGKSMKRFISKYFRQIDGATAIEYGIIASGVCLVVAVSVFVLGDALENMITGFTSVLDGDPDG